MTYKFYLSRLLTNTYEDLPLQTVHRLSIKVAIEMHAPLGFCLVLVFVCCRTRESLQWRWNENRSSPRSPLWAALVDLIIMERNSIVVFMLKCFTESPPGLLILQLSSDKGSFFNTLNYCWQSNPSIPLETNLKQSLPCKTHLPQRLHGLITFLTFTHERNSISC